MSVVVQDNTVRVLAQVQNGASLGLLEMTEDVIRISKPNTPRDKGDLRARILKQNVGTPLKRKITWSSEHASYQERGSRIDGSRRVRKYSTAGTGKDFAKNAVDVAQSQPQKYFGRTV